MQISPQLIFSRAFWLKIHVYIAVSLGCLLAIIGLTGSISVYQQDIDEFLNPDLVIEQPQGSYQSLDMMMNAVRKWHPERTGTWTLEMPRSAQSMAIAWYDKPRETFFEYYAPLMVSVNPYTAKVVANRFWGHTFVTWVQDLHTQLLLDRWGWNAVGLLSILLIFSVLSGLYLWWPGWSGLAAALMIQYRAGLMKLLFDLHRLLGLFSAAPIIILALTGLLLSYPAILENMFGASGMAHGETGKNITSTAIPNNHPTGLSAAAFVAQGPFPKAELRRVTTPAGTSGIYRINLRQKSEINQRHPFTTVWVDRWSGQIKEVRNPSMFSQGETIATTIWPVHTGEALGATGRFVWFLTGQSMFWLYVSGMARWLYKKGLLKDRPVDFSKLKYTVNQLASTGLVLLKKGIIVVNQAANQLKPHLIVSYNKFRQWLLQQVILWRNRRQHRIGKDN